MTLEIEDVKEGVYEHPRKVFKGKAELNTITLRQGVQFINSDFYDWIQGALTGNVTRRNLLLVQFSRMRLGSGTGDVGGLGGVIDFSPRVPGRAWFLMQCLPTRYKTASDFDALDSAVSIQELDFVYEAMFQFDLGI